MTKLSEDGGDCTAPVTEDTMAPRKKSAKSRKPIILCVGENGRAVVYGRVDSDPVPGEAVTLHGARMVLYWDAECNGLFGLAANGPKGSTRLTPTIARTTAVVWREALDVSEAAAEGMESWA